MALPRSVAVLVVVFLVLWRGNGFSFLDKSIDVSFFFEISRVRQQWRVSKAFLFPAEGEASTFTFVNRCADTVWPGILSNAGSPRLEPTGFELQPGAARAVPAPSGWSGRMWARTGCSQDGATGRLVCATGDCGSGAAECAGAGAAPPATLAEFTLDGSGGLDFYDVSLVDGYNLPVLVETSGGGGSSRPASYAAAGCAADLNTMCPAAVRGR